MIKTVTALLVLGVPVGAIGQASGGLAAGVGTGAVSIRNIDNQFIEAIEGRGIVGYEVGLFMKVPAGPLYLRPQLLYSRATGMVDYEEFDGDAGRSDFTIHRLQVPITLGVSILGPIGVEGAIVYNRMLHATERFGPSTIQLGRSGLGYRIGPALDLDPLVLHLSYEGAAYSSSINRTAFREPHRLVFGLGIRL